MMEKKKNSIDMTHGALWNKILIFALPQAASVSYSSFLTLSIPLSSATLPAARL